MNKNISEASMKKNITAYIEAFTTLTPETLDDLIALMADDVVLTDPFNQAQGAVHVRRIFAHMFETCANPRFIVSDYATGEHATYLRWQMTGRLKSWPRTEINLEGISEIRFNEVGKVSHHIDHWDGASQVLMTLPLIRTVIRPVMRQFCAD